MTEYIKKYYKYKQKYLKLRQNGGIITPSNDLCNLKTEKLTEHTIECPDNQILTRYQLITQQDPLRIHYDFNCKNNTLDNANKIELPTELNDYGLGNTVYLDRHHIECPPNYALSKIKLNKIGEQINFDYTCTDSNLHDITQHETPVNDDGNGQITYLDRHNITCPDGKYLNSVRLERANDSNGIMNKYKFIYNCGSILLPSIPAAAATNESNIGNAINPNDYIMYGPWINDNIRVNRIEILPDNTRLYIIHHNNTVKITDDNGNCYYYNGLIDDFNINNLKLYNICPKNVYLIKEYRYHKIEQDRIIKWSKKVDGENGHINAHIQEQILIGKYSARKVVDMYQQQIKEPELKRKFNELFDNINIILSYNDINRFEDLKKNITDLLTYDNKIENLKGNENVIILNKILTIQNLISIDDIIILWKKINKFDLERIFIRYNFPHTQSHLWCPLIWCALQRNGYDVPDEWCVIRFNNSHFEGEFNREIDVLAADKAWVKHAERILLN